MYILFNDQIFQIAHCQISIPLIHLQFRLGQHVPPSYTTIFITIPVSRNFLDFRICNLINKTGANSGAVTAYPSGAHEFTSGFLVGFMLLDL